MPIYEYHCEECGSKTELLQSRVGEIPLCCAEVMSKLPTFPAVIKLKGDGGIKLYSKGYKEGYAKDYQKDVPLLEPSKTQ